jgi:hypothetical protein
MGAKERAVGLHFITNLGIDKGFQPHYHRCVTIHLLTMAKPFGGVYQIVIREISYWLNVNYNVLKSSFIHIQHSHP